MHKTLSMHNDRNMNKYSFQQTYKGMYIPGSVLEISVIVELGACAPASLHLPQFDRNRRRYSLKHLLASLYFWLVQNSLGSQCEEWQRSAISPIVSHQ